jgi:hypothetical protein
MSDLQQMLLRVQRSGFDSTAYEGPAAEVAFELTTFDTFIAGIASTLLLGRALTAQGKEREILQQGLPLTGSVWTTESGARVDLATFPGLLAHARLLNSLIEACIRN